MNAMKCALVVLLVGSMQVALEAQSLKGSRSSMRKQYNHAQKLDLDRLTTASQVRLYVRLGYLVKLNGNSNYRLHDVSHPYVRPAVKLFIERVSAQYRAACGEKLEVLQPHSPTSRTATECFGTVRASCRNVCRLPYSQEAEV